MRKYCTFIAAHPLSTPSHHLNKLPWVSPGLHWRPRCLGFQWKLQLVARCRAQVLESPGPRPQTAAFFGRFQRNLGEEISWKFVICRSLEKRKDTLDRFGSFECLLTSSDIRCLTLLSMFVVFLCGDVWGKRSGKGIYDHDVADCRRTLFRMNISWFCLLTKVFKRYGISCCGCWEFCWIRISNWTNWQPFPIGSHGVAEVVESKTRVVYINVCRYVQDVSEGTHAEHGPQIMDTGITATCNILHSPHAFPGLHLLLFNFKDVLVAWGVQIPQDTFCRVGSGCSFTGASLASKDVWNA